MVHIFLYDSLLKENQTQNAVVLLACVLYEIHTGLLTHYFEYVEDDLVP